MQSVTFMLSNIFNTVNLAQWCNYKYKWISPVFPTFLLVFWKNIARHQSIAKDCRDIGDGCVV